MKAASFQLISGSKFANGLGGGHKEVNQPPPFPFYLVDN